MATKSTLSALALAFALPMRRWRRIGRAQQEGRAKNWPSVAETAFGTLDDGGKVTLYTLTNASGAEAKIINYGATVVSLKVPDRQGKLRDVVLGYDDLAGYVKDKDFFGSPSAAIGNRIGAGKFTLDGKTYQLDVNNGPNHLHGGAHGFYKKLWKAEPVKGKDGPGVKLTYVSKDGEEGYPGTVTLTVTYTLTRENGLRIDYHGTTDKPTVLNPTHHSYFNLSGDPNADHPRRRADHRCRQDDTGRCRASFRRESWRTSPVRPWISARPPRLAPASTPRTSSWSSARAMTTTGCFAALAKKVRKVVELFDPTSGIVMQILTDQPGLQFYSGNFLNGTIHGKARRGVSAPHGAVVLKRSCSRTRPTTRRFPAPCFGRANLQADHRLPILHPLTGPAC